MGQQTKESSLLSLIPGTQQTKLAVLSQELGLFARMEFDFYLTGSKQVVFRIFLDFHSRTT